MGKQSRKSRGDAKFGTGDVTEVQIAFLVECYLKDNRYTKTLNEFRTEASSVLFPFKSEAPMTMMSLSAILNDYILLKEQMLAFQQEKARMDHMFGRLHDMVATYHSTPSVSPPPAPEVPPLMTGAVASCSKVESSPVVVAQSNTSTKRKTPMRIMSLDGPMVDITNTATRSKRIRLNSAALNVQWCTDVASAKSHSPKQDQSVLQGVLPKTSPVQPVQPKQFSATPDLKSLPAHSQQVLQAPYQCGPLSPPSLHRPLAPTAADPQTPQQCVGVKATVPSDHQMPQVSSEKGTPYIWSTKDARVSGINNVESCEPRKARSKRQPLKAAKPQTSKCKSLDFTSTEPVEQIAVPSPEAPQEKPSNGQPLPVELGAILSEDLFNPEPLSSIDDILGTSLDGPSFSDLMNSVMDDMMEEMNSPCSQSPSIEETSQCDRVNSDCANGFMADIICLEEDLPQVAKDYSFQETSSINVPRDQPAPKSRRSSIGKENSPPR